MNKMNEVKPLGNLGLEVVVQWEQTYVSANPNKRRCRVICSFIDFFGLYKNCSLAPQDLWIDISDIVTLQDVR